MVISLSPADSIPRHLPNVSRQIAEKYGRGEEHWDNNFEDTYSAECRDCTIDA
jgi:hypothetical protein